MSFLEGFSSSLGGYFSNQALMDQQAKREQASYEQKLKLAKELEKNTAVGQQVFERDGKLFSVGMNSSGEQIGTERPASEWQIAQRQSEQDLANRDRVKDEADVRNKNALSDRYDVDARLAPEREKRDAAQSAASINASNASARNSNANADYQNIISEFTRANGGPLSRADPNKELSARDVSALTSSPEFQELAEGTPEDQQAASLALSNVESGQQTVAQALISLSRLRLQGSQPTVQQPGASDVDIATFLSRTR